MKILILSGSTKFRTVSFLNHQYFCDKNSYQYIYEFIPTQEKLKANYLYKIHILKKYSYIARSFDYIFWIDDDVLFTDFKNHKPLEKIIENSSFPNLLFAKSPTDAPKGKTWISSGNFFFTPNNLLFDFFEECLKIDPLKVKEEWDYIKYGDYWGGDQEIITYLLNKNHKKYNFKFKRINYRFFNTRPYHYKVLKNVLLVHFTGSRKSYQFSKFAKKFKAPNNVLIPNKILYKYIKNMDPIFLLNLRIRSYFAIYVIPFPKKIIKAIWNSVFQK